MMYYLLFNLLLICGAKNLKSDSKTNNISLPLVISTWPGPTFVAAAQRAWTVLNNDNDRISSVIAGCKTCQSLQCDGTVGYGGSPDEDGETTLEAMIMDGVGHRMGAVGDLRDIKNAIGVAHAVMKYTKHSFLVGESASKFAEEMGFNRTNLSTKYSKNTWEQWMKNNCQPNFWTNDLTPNPKTSCGPYKPSQYTKSPSRSSFRHIDKWNHDTIGIGAIDRQGNAAVATSTNGASHKIHGRVGDSPLPGAGAYVDNTVGFAAATGDGDIMMRFLPAYQAVESMRQGSTPEEAATDAISRIARVYRGFSGAVIAGDKKGRWGAACHGMDVFQYEVGSASFGDAVRTMAVICV